VECLCVSERLWGGTLDVLLQGGNIRSLAFNYIVMLLNFYLVVVVSLDTL
jgi:hypothetical protein